MEAGEEASMQGDKGAGEQDWKGANGEDGKTGYSGRNKRSRPSSE